MELFVNPNVQSILAVGAVMAIVALAITIPATLAEARKSSASVRGDARTRLETRIGYLEGEIGALAVEIERIGESQRYITRLLTKNH